MKKIILITASILLFSVSATFAQKYAYVDTDYILNQIPEYRMAQTQLDNLAVQWQKELEEKFSKIDNMYKSYQAEAPLLDPETKKQRQELIIKLEKEAKDLQKKRFGTDGDLHKKRQELIKPIQDKVYNAIKEIAETGNLAFVLDKSSGATILYVDPKYDKSDDVLNKLGITPSSKKSNK